MAIWYYHYKYAHHHPVHILLHNCIHSYQQCWYKVVYIHHSLPSTRLCLHVSKCCTEYMMLNQVSSHTLTITHVSICCQHMARVTCAVVTAISINAGMLTVNNRTQQCLKRSRSIKPVYHCASILFENTFTAYIASPSRITSTCIRWWAVSIETWGITYSCTISHT